MASYYDRELAAHLDGTPIFATAEDRKSEEHVARLLEGRWQCELRPFGQLCVIDWYALRHERMVGVLELKTRSHASDTYETVFLNFRKWIALQMAANGAGVPGVFVVRFTDGIRWIPTNKINASKIRMGGCSKRVKSDSDVEPVIEIPVADMETMEALASA